MNGGNRVVAIGAGGPDTDRDEILLAEELAPLDEEQAVTEWPEPEPEPGKRSRARGLWPGLAAIPVVGWTGLFAWRL